jgi:cyclopropane-fatty-acyl-phospholipid synthase
MIEHSHEAAGSGRRSNEAVRRSLAFLDDLVRDVQTRNFAVRLWDGTEWELGASEHEFTLVLRHPGALRAMFWRPSELRLAEAYIYDDFDVEGDLRAFVAVGYDLLGAADMDGAQRARQASRLLALPRERRTRDGAGLTSLRGRRDSLERARRAVSYHYDTSNEFFELFLDPRLVYTCAYFSEANESIEAAQERKLEYVCRKLRLQPGDRLLDVGCGWGSLAVYAAERYGVDVLGVTLSGEQAELANRRIAAAGLAARARVELLDFREVDEPEGFDKIAAVGFIEHLGEGLLPNCFSHLFGLLRPGGVFLNHAIARRVDFAKPSREVSFLGRYVFPDAELTPVGGVIRAAEDVGFEIRDVESLREHYILTCGRWLDRLEANHEAARRLTSETTYRIFRLYLAGSAHTFETGGVNLYQTLLAKPDRGVSGLPLARSDWYA